MNISKTSLNLFLEYAKDADYEWNGIPMFTGSKKDLVDLRQAGLIRTEVSRGNTFILFTNAGKTLAAANGIKIL